MAHITRSFVARPSLGPGMERRSMMLQGSPRCSHNLGSHRAHGALRGAGVRGNVCTWGNSGSLSQRRDAWVRGDVCAQRGFGFLSQRTRTAGFARLRWRLAGGKLGEGKGFVVRCGRDDDSVDGPIQEPQYTSYIDPNTGEPMPTFGARTPFPDQAFWGEDMVRIKRSGQASTPRTDTREPPPEPIRAREFVSNRKKSNAAKRSAASTEGLDGIEEDKDKAAAESEEANSKEKLWYAKNDPENDPIRASFREIDDEEEEEGEDEDGDEKEEDAGARPPSGLTRNEDEAVVPASAPPLANEELWWNWQKPPKDKEPWSAWHKRPGDSDTVMAAAMAETGQIKLFGEKPTIAEATLARARKRVFYNERMWAEEQRRVEGGSMAYYHEWVKAWPRDTSLEAIKEQEEKTGEGVVDQLLDMFQNQTRREYRHMQGTDIRIRRDPLTMRMREDQIKQVWGGDPVYPTINYVQDPDCVADYRNANMHEPTPDIIESLRESGRLITQEDIHRLQAMEKAQELEVGVFDDGMTGAIDIGDKEEDEDDDDDDDEEEDAVEDADAWKVDVESRQQAPAAKAKEAEKPAPVFDLDKIGNAGLVDLDDSEEDEDEDEDEESGPIEEQEE